MSVAPSRASGNRRGVRPARRAECLLRRRGATCVSRPWERRAPRGRAQNR